HLPWDSSKAVRRGPRLHAARPSVPRRARASERDGDDAVVGEPEPGGEAVHGRRVVARSAGVLLHPTSLPGRFPIGDLGPAAIEFLDWAASAGQTLWQVLPLGPIGAGSSPYTSASAFAGNPLLLSPERLVEEDLLPAGALADAPRAGDRVDFGAAREWKERLLRASWARVLERAGTNSVREELLAFVRAKEQGTWLEDWARFAALKARLGDRPWTDWGPDLAFREPEALAAADAELAGEIA